jgi:hypothetical protein
VSRVNVTPRTQIQAGALDVVVLTRARGSVVQGFTKIEAVTNAAAWMDNYDNILIDGTVWSALTRNPQFIAKKLEDQVSYGWDSVIDRAHDGTSEHYECLARELARPDRFTRRVISKSFLEAYGEYMDKKPPIFRRMTAFGDTTYCFLLMEDGKGPRERRKARARMECPCHLGMRTEGSQIP